MTASAILDTRVGASNNFSVSYSNGTSIHGIVKFSSIDDSLFPDTMRMTVRLTSADEATMATYLNCHPNGVICIFRKTEGLPNNSLSDTLYIILEWEQILVELLHIESPLTHNQIVITQNRL